MHQIIGRCGHSCHAVGRVVIACTNGNDQSLAIDRYIIERLSNGGKGGLRFRLYGGKWPDPAKLEQCSCSIDLIATILPYDDYVEAETILSVGLVGGEKATIFNQSPALREVVATMRRAQAEAEFRCF